MLRARYRRVSFLFSRILISLAFWELLLPRLGLRGLVNRTRPKRLQKIGAHFRSQAVQLGGVLIKVGQFLSSRVDVIPEELTKELAGLQDEVPPEDFSAVRQVAEAELGARLEEKYLEFDSEPLAAASLGQVHRARLAGSLWDGGIAQPDGAVTNVVVKVQRPDIERIIATDMAALRGAGEWINRYPPVRKRANVPALIDEFERILYQEIDYEGEGRNAETFAENFKENPMVRVPRVAWSHTTRRVLTLEDVQAIKITNYDTITAAGIDRGEVASCLLDTYMQQIFEDGFFHADPHPGNLFVYPLDPPRVLDEESGDLIDWQLAFVDFGMAGRVTPQMKAGLRELLVSIGTRDTARTIRAFELMGVLLPGADVTLIERAEAEAFDRYWGKSMSELQQVSLREMTEFALRFRDLIYQMPFQVPQDLILIGRAVGILSGMCTGLDPQFNVWEEILPYARKLVTEEGGAGESLLQVLVRSVQRLAELPIRMEKLLTQMERGELEVRNPTTAESMHRLERAVRRAGLGIVTVGLLLAGVQLFLAGYQTPAWILWVLSAVVTLWALLR